MRVHPSTTQPPHSRGAPSLGSVCTFCPCRQPGNRQDWEGKVGLREVSPVTDPARLTFALPLVIAVLFAGFGNSNGWGPVTGVPGGRRRSNKEMLGGKPHPGNKGFAFDHPARAGCGSPLWGEEWGRVAIDTGMAAPINSTPKGACLRRRRLMRLPLERDTALGVRSRLVAVGCLRFA